MKNPPVSEIIGKDEMKSKYFSVKYRPEGSFELKTACSSFLTYLAIADALQDDRSMQLVSEKWNTLISLCQNDEQRKEVIIFLKEATLKGGYAKDFYDQIRQGVLKEKKTVKKEEKVQNNNPVSIITKTGIQSKYFDIQYRPSGSLRLKSTCNSFLNKLALVDASRSEEESANLNYKFYEVLAFCTSPKELEDVATLLEETAKVGGFAVEYNNIMKKYINYEGRENAIAILKKREEEKKQKKEEKEEQMDSYQAFQKKYDFAIRQYMELTKKSRISAEELEFLKEEFERLKIELINLDIQDSKMQIELQLDIETKIGQLTSMYESLKEYEAVFRTA